MSHPIFGSDVTAKVLREPEQSRTVFRNLIVLQRRTGIWQGRSGFSELRRSGQHLESPSKPQQVFGSGVVAKVPRNRSNWVGKPFGAERFRKASGSVPCGHDARTASEHLAPFPILHANFDWPPETRNGVRLPLAIEPRSQRQLMHFRVCAPVREQIHRILTQINHMSRLLCKKPQYSGTWRICG